MSRSTEWFCYVVSAFRGAGLALATQAGLIDENCARIFLAEFRRLEPGAHGRYVVARVPRPGNLAALTSFGGAGVVVLTFVALGARTLAETNGMRPTTALPIAPWAAAMIGVNLAHYWLDHRIWRTKTPASNAPIMAAHST
jgi:hypothetical protein